MVKNPIAPDINLWIGAIERLQKSVIPNIFAIHRGFVTPYNSVFRNIPLWNIALQLKRKMPDIPILCDPSHIAGRSELVASVAEIALEFGFDGLMIESHYNPSEALSDSAQQITPSVLKNMIKRLGINYNTQFNDTDIIKEHLELLQQEANRILQEKNFIEKNFYSLIKGGAENLKE